MVVGKDLRGRTELIASSSTVDIVSIPWRFFAVKYDQLDQLFLPMLSSAQQANDVSGLRAGGPEAALHAAALFGGELLRDGSFAPVRQGSVNAANACLIDFGENSFQVETSVSARDANIASFFRVKVSGAIRGDKFIVTDPVTRNSLFSFTKFEANKPDFFSSEFPFIAHESRQNPTSFVGDNTAMVRGVIDLVLGIPVGHDTITVRIYKQSDILSAEVRNPITNETVMSVPLSSLGNITKLVETIAQHLSANTAARLSLTPRSEAPALGSNEDGASAAKDDNASAPK
ncbi:MAG TPA: hypothetical protein VHS29_01230 [Candidatus Acidoferrales bacterium]|jgi:hypothetical protein|nr:hypothetical protein [Candidatus Acidoferrales bacterium]